MNRLKGKNIVITGASSGIGREVALLAAKQGARVVLLARSVEKMMHLVAEIKREHGTEAYAFKLDVSDTEQVREVFDKVALTIGDIDVLVNNAGFGLFKDLHEADIEETKDMFNVNVIGLIACTGMVVPAMKRRRSGHIINIASQAGKIATPRASVYSATKHAVLGFSNSLRLELMDEGIYVTTVNPGPIETNFFNIADQSGNYVSNIQKFMLKPEYVAQKIVSAMLTKRREINLPRWMSAGSVFYTLFPGVVETLGKKAFFKK
ncbi:SDR family NAD(P)-dependent oxidoreductase [Peribacillus sp. SCS-155]|uniref:SDR family NAD(P)-dependent oxidoreductase n=1 Tax=Peribacillus sedimenti TaxID=3115297 RepID=UPI003905FCF8